MIKALLAAPLAYVILFVAWVIKNRPWENKATGPAARVGFSLNPLILLHSILAKPLPTPPDFYRGETITGLTALVDRLKH